MKSAHFNFAHNLTKESIASRLTFDVFYCTVELLLFELNLCIFFLKIDLCTVARRPQQGLGKKIHKVQVQSRSIHSNVGIDYFHCNIIFLLNAKELF